MRRPHIVLRERTGGFMKKKHMEILGLTLSLLFLGGCAEIEPEIESFLDSLGEDGQETAIRYQKLSAVFDKMGKGMGLAIVMIEPEDLEENQEIEYYPAVAEYAVDMEIDGETYISRETDENAVHVFGEAQVVLKNAEISRIAKDSGEEGDLSAYGVGAAMLTTSGTSYLKNNTITTRAERGTGIFAYGDGTTYAVNTTINTKRDSSKGIQAAKGGTVYGWNLKAGTEGNDSPAVRSDSRGSSLILDGGTYSTKGMDSPAVYSAGNTVIHGGYLAAEQWEAICMKGNQSLSLYDCDVSGNKADDISNDCTWNVILYQNGAGGFTKGKSTFEMNGGTLTARNGGLFYTTNVDSAITLSNVKITYPAVNGFFLRCTGNNNQREWGKSGANGADCLFTAVNQDMIGDVIWDSISRLDFYMSEGSVLRGAVRQEENYAGSGGEGHCNLYIGEGCTWIVTGNSTLGRLSCQGTIVDDEGNAVMVHGKDQTLYMQGNSKYTVAVDTFETQANMSGASQPTQWMDHQVEIPQEMQ